MRGQELYRDFDFDGANLNVILELLAVNTYRNAFYHNMAISEGFLDSAQMKASVLSRAKDLNYTPRSARSAKATVTVTFQATGESAPYLIAKGESFSSLVKNDSYVFSIPEAITVASTNTSFSFTTDIYEGNYLKDSYVFKNSVENQRFRITNKNVDTTSLTVTVYEDGSAVGTNYILATSLLDLNESSKVYFLQASESGFYEVLFGDNIIGREPKPGSTILLDYRISNRTTPNGAKTFVLNFDPTGISGELTTSPEITTTSVASGGADEESLESIRYYAPRHFQIQERVVTTSDYENALKAQFPEINAVSAYGGEELTPKRYGKVLVAVDISNVEGFPESKRAEYYSFLKSRCPSSVEPIFTDPDYIYLDVISKVRYNINSTNASQESIKTLASSAISTYNTDFLDDFRVTLRYSKLIEAIDDSHSSIISNITDIRVYKKIQPAIGTPQNVTIDFGMAISPTLVDEDSDSTTKNEVLTSSLFTYNGESVCLLAHADGTVHVAKSTPLGVQEITNIGTVDYSTGVVSLRDWIVDEYEGEAIKLYVKPADRDVKSPRNTIMSIPSDSISITVEGIRE